MTRHQKFNGRKIKLLMCVRNKWRKEENEAYTEVFEEDLLVGNMKITIYVSTYSPI